MTSLIDQALTTATDTRAIAEGPGAVHRTGQVFTDLFGSARAIIVADQNTFAAAGAQVEASLRAAGVELEPAHLFPGTPTLYAGYENVEPLREALRRVDAIAVCIGSGTLNDLTKLASGELGRPYVVVCTAASMDGYAAFGASITRDGFKITRECPAPAGIIADLDVMAAAPGRLTASGYGDLIEKIPGGADWLVADELGIEPIDEQVWALVQGPLRQALADPAGCAAGEPSAIGELAQGLLMSGLAMQAHQSSRPASGAGHNFSHQWEMEGHGLDWEPPLSHGNKVGIGTICLCALYEQVLTLDVAGLDVDAALASHPDPAADAARVADLQPLEAIREAALGQSRAKYVAPEQLRARIELIQQHWPTIIDRVKPQLVSGAEAMAMLRAVGAPYHPAQLGIDQAQLRTTYYQAQTLRSRYTILDALAELGLLDQVIESLFAPGGFWAEHPQP